MYRPTLPVCMNCDQRAECRPAKRNVTTLSRATGFRLVNVCRRCAEKLIAAATAPTISGWSVTSLRAVWGLVALDREAAVAEYAAQQRLSA